MLIASGEAKERFRKLIYAEAASGAKHDHDFTTPREYVGVYLDRRRESGFQQMDFVQAQMQSMTEQAKELGEATTKAMLDSAKPAKGGLSS